MAWDETEDTAIYKVVINHEEQYSIWPAERENALGWNDVGKSGLKQECLDYIAEVWTDMRPLSLRNQMAVQARQSAPAPAPAPAPPASQPPEPAIDPLVQQLSAGDHPVVARRAQNSAAELHNEIERGLVHITFTETQGGTELGIRLDDGLSDLSQADFNQGIGRVNLVGNLTLNDVKVRCHAEIDLGTGNGTGHLVIVDEST